MTQKAKEGQRITDEPQDGIAKQWAGIMRNVVRLFSLGINIQLCTYTNLDSIKKSITQCGLLRQSKGSVHIRCTRIQQI